MTPFDAKTYWKYVNYITKVQQTHCDQNMPSVYKDVVAFYERHDLGQRDANGILDICVSVDGVFSHTKQARQCTTFASEVYSVFQLDCVTSELCYVCETKKDRGTVCERGLVHGDSGQLEVENVKKLFERSLDRGFR